ncbi:hypothetical protein W02_31270 [Nitrospira sp. KM1]|uniref:outer membrane beta-barrel protein n=1 Tax=Nitrospira sp. KM1 TaxID=1936990 RepID=UPI0013A75AE3|nr:outer membrane beta-barrel protein [Nitrospira sp. KM1]BCA55987.1 hypothetical protein W02_31270 [Nitrospira sp. KM1]
MAFQHGQAADVWQYGGFLDLAYELNYNFPENHQWRSKETSPRTNELAPNMGLAYLRKDPARESRWGMELAFQGGYDTDALVPQPNASGVKPIEGADTLRYLARANVSYLAPVGHGLTISAGLIKGMKTYEEFYAKYNINYTRAYLTDYNPNFMIGVGASSEITKSFELGLYIVNEYQHLSHANDLPSYVAKMEWRAGDHVTLYQNLYYGPDQRDTSLRFWRIFSDSTVEWRTPEWKIALSYDVGSEEMSDAPTNARAAWMGAALFTQRHLAGPWSVGIRPEFYWDPQGRMTERDQLLWANSTTLEYKRHFGQQLAIVRFEYRYDHSSGAQGGFFHHGSALGVPKIVPSQHLTILGLVLAFDSA